MRAPKNEPTWKPAFGFAVLICLPLVVGALRQIPTSHESLDKANTVSPSTTTQPPSRTGETLLVAIEQASEAQTDTRDKSDTALQVDDTGETTESTKPEGSETSQEKDDKSDRKEKSNAENESETDDRESEDEEEVDAKSDEIEENEEPVCCDATSEFEQWTLTLDETIQKAVANAITSELADATYKLDQQHARLERLLVETELYKLQIQHLRSRLKEWQPPAKDEDEETTEEEEDVKEDAKAEESTERSQTADEEAAKD